MVIGTLKIVGNATIRCGAYDFLYSPLTETWYHFRDIDNHLSKAAMFPNSRRPTFGAAVGG